MGLKTMPKSDIPTLQEAQNALETLQRFLDTMSTMFGQVTSPPIPHKSSPAPSATKSHKKKNGKLTWKQKVTEIMQDAPRPVRPKFITDQFEERFGWDGKRSVLGNRIRSTLALMKKDGDISLLSSGYVLPKQSEDSQ